MSHCLTAAKYCQLSICQQHHTSGLHGHGHGHGRDRHIYVLARALPRNHDTLRKTSCCEDRPGRAQAKEDKAALLACFSKSYQFLLPVPRPTSQRCLCQGCQLKSIKEATLRLFRLTPTYLPVPACVLFLSHCCCWTTTASPSPGAVVPWSRPGLCASLYLCLAFFLLHPSPPTL